MNHLYCIVIIPPEPIYSETREFQEHFAEKYKSKAALKPPPHLTLIPPAMLASEKEAVIFRYLENIASNYEPFEVSIDGFGSFGVGVIYAELILTDPLRKLEKELSLSFYKKFHVERGPSHRFIAHITLAYKDLNPPMFAQAWEEFKDKLYRRKWTPDGITLLRNNPKGGWDQIYKAKFGMKKDSLF